MKKLDKCRRDGLVSNLQTIQANRNALIAESVSRFLISTRSVGNLQTAGAIPIAAIPKPLPTTVQAVYQNNTQRWLRRNHQTTRHPNARCQPRHCQRTALNSGIVLLSELRLAVGRRGNANHFHPIARSCVPRDVVGCSPAPSWGRAGGGQRAASSR